MTFLVLLFKVLCKRVLVSSHSRHHYYVVSLTALPSAGRNCIKRESCCIEQYLRVDYNLTLCRLQHIYHGHGQPYARVDFIPQSGTKNLAAGWYLPFPLGLLPVLSVSGLEARLEGGILPMFVDECAAIYRRHRQQEDFFKFYQSTV